MVDIYRNWSWPAQPVTRQREWWRGTFTERLSRDKPLLLTEDDSFVYVVPGPTANWADGRLTVVCYAGTGQTGCGYGHTETPAGTWSLHYGRFVNPNPGLADLSPAALARETATGQWRVIRRTRLDGKPAIELTQTPAARVQYQRPVFLWVNARTHLPLRMIESAGQPIWDQTDWRYLPPTRAGQALLRVPVPPGLPPIRVTPHLPEPAPLPRGLWLLTALTFRF